MSFVTGMIAGVVLTIGGVWAYTTYLDKTGQLMDFEDVVQACAKHLNGRVVVIPDHFPIYVDEEQDDKHYIDVDQIRLVVEDGELVGWYDPSGELEA